VRRLQIIVLVALLALLPQRAVLGQRPPGPAALPAEQSVPDARDIPYPGVIKLAVDATDPAQAIFRVRETIPVVTPGRLTLLYPQWLPGTHGPSGPIEKLAGLVVTANGQPLEWRRDPVEMFAFHLDPPAGTSAIEVEFQYTSPTAPSQGRIESTPDMLGLQWSRVSLYPAGYYVRQIQVEASLRLPSGWKFATALDSAESKDGAPLFKTVSYETLVDSPVFAGRHFRQIDLDPEGRSPVRLNLLGDRPADLEIKPEKLTRLRKLVREADTLFASRHFDHYDFLLALSDRLGGIGLEHHRSSENAARTGYFENVTGLDLLPHEYVHSWNGKFRRGADLWTPDYRTPMRNSLLWVYEGQTQYWGQVLSARSGLLTKQQALDALALDAAVYEARAGRAWRPLSDTTNEPILPDRGRDAWRSWQRSVDYYVEGQLIWLDIDTLLRERTDDKTSLDDFAKAFFGTDDGSWVTKTYVFDDIVAALNALVPNDWSGFLKARLEGRGAAPLDGLARGGYRLVYGDEPSEFQRAYETRVKRHDFSFSLGLSIGDEGQLAAVAWGGPAFKAGLTVGDYLVAVNGEAFMPKNLKDAIAAARTEQKPIELLLKNGSRYRTVAVDYQGGLRFPRLQRIDGVPARLDAILDSRS
jgi:predicted metalloprotease with PDZ domain